MIPGGMLDIGIKDDFMVTITGPATKVAEGAIIPDIWRRPISPGGAYRRNSEICIKKTLVKGES